MSERKELIRDLTSGSVPGTLLRFSMPLFLSGLLQMVYNMVDMIVVGQMVGTEGLSAVSIGGEMMMLITFIPKLTSRVSSANRTSSPICMFVMTDSICVISAAESMA